MNKKSFFLVLGIAALAALSAYLVADRRALQTTVAADAVLVPGLSERLNDVSQVVITGAGGEVKVTLDRGESAWTVAQRDGYVAQPAKIRSFLIELADARLVERKTAREENYPALGVQDIASESATGVEIAVAGVGDDARFIIGKSTRGGNAVYVRRSDEETAWVADKRLRVERKPVDWLVKDLIDVNAARVQRVTITHPDGEVVDAVRGEANFEVADLPDGKTLSSPTAANALAGVLDDLKFEDVLAKERFDAGDAQPVMVRFETSDGLVIDASATAANNKYYLALSTTARAVDAAALGSADAAAEGGVSPEQKVATMLEAISNQSAQINARVDGWVFTIPLFKYEQLARTKADLIGE
jgi:hypothetical protein